MATWWQRDDIVMSKHDEQTKRTLDTIKKRWAYQKKLRISRSLNPSWVWWIVTMSKDEEA